jgi:hypothetical protein
LQTTSKRIANAKTSKFQQNGLKRGGEAATVRGMHESDTDIQPSSYGDTVVCGELLVYLIVPTHAFTCAEEAELQAAGWPGRVGLLPVCGCRIR